MNIYEHLEVVFSERRGEAKRRSSKFRKYASEEEKLYTKLKEGMTEEQRELLEGYLTAVSATQAVVETLSYKQGMTDMLAFLKCMECKEED